jgi:hypothetical protein
MMTCLRANSPSNSVKHAKLRVSTTHNIVKVSRPEPAARDLQGEILGGIGIHFPNTDGPVRSSTALLTLEIVAWAACDPRAGLV